MRRLTTLIPILVAALACALPATAAADATSDRIYYDCEHSPTGALTGHYSHAQLRRALDNIPGDVQEYSGCYDAINQALLAGGRSGGGSGPNGGGIGSSGGGAGSGPNSGALGTGADGNGAGAAGGYSGPVHVGTKAPVQLPGGGVVRPGVVPSIGRDAHTLPTPLIAFLVLLAAGVLLPASTTLGRRVIARRRA
jgi:hypothetical protein